MTVDITYFEIENEVKLTIISGYELGDESGKKRENSLLNQRLEALGIDVPDDFKNGKICSVRFSLDKIQDMQQLLNIFQAPFTAYPQGIWKPIGLTYDFRPIIPAAQKDEYRVLEGNLHKVSSPEEFEALKKAVGALKVSSLDMIQEKIDSRSASNTPS